MLRRFAAAALALLLAACTSSVARSGATTQPTRPSSSRAPSAARSSEPVRASHILVVVLENHSFDEVVGRSDAPFLDALAATGAVLTQSYAVAHPSEPNYLALFSGSTQGITSDACPLTFAAPNLASSLLAAGRTFAGYSEGLPSVGYTGCSDGAYARKHVPWVDFSNVPASANLPISAFPSDFTQLPTVGFVIPSLDDDMHDGSRAQADAWLRDHLAGYVQWARTHDSLLIVTTDEDDYSESNRVATIVVGAGVRPGTYAQRVDHYGVLRWIEAMYELPLLGQSATAAAIPARVWGES